MIFHPKITVHKAKRSQYLNVWALLERGFYWNAGIIQAWDEEIWYIKTIRIQAEQNNWGVESWRKI